MSAVSFHVGIDWGNEKHAICVIDADGRVRKEQMVNNDLTLLEVLLNVTGGVPPETVHIALEDRRNAVADTLVAHGFRVHTINPKQVDRFRDRENVAGAKDDRRDARVLARTLRTDGDFFHLVEVPTEHLMLLRGCTGAIEELERDRRRKSNQLRALLLRFYPALLALCPGTDELWFWELVLLLRSVEHAKKVTDKKLTELLQKHRRRLVTLETLRSVIDAKHLHTSPGVAVASFENARVLIESLRLLERQLKAATKARDELLKVQVGEADGPSDAELLCSVPGIANKTAAILLVDAALPLQSGQLGLLRALAGVAPVTKRSGKSTSIVMRRACNNRLRQALYHAAGTLARHDQRFATQYRRLCERGHTHARACRGVADRLLTVLVAMMKSRELFRQQPIEA